MSPGRQLGLLWGLVAVALVALSPLAPRLAPGLPACPVKTLAGVPCPTCGSTRAALALADFDPAAALATSPLATAGWVGLVGGGLVAGALALAGRELPRPPRWTRGRLLAFRVLAGGSLLANWIYLVVAGV